MNYFHCSSREHMLESLNAYKSGYIGQGKDDFSVAIDYFTYVVIQGRREMGHYFIDHGDEGKTFRDGEIVQFLVVGKPVATGRLAELINGPHGDEGGNRFFYLSDVRIEC